MPLRHLGRLVDEVAPLAERFGRAGHRLYLVGGAVRDAWLDRVDPGRDDDLDLTTDARPEQILTLVDGWADAVWTQGARFGTIGCRRAGRAYEITTHRAEVYLPESRKPEVTFADAVEVDLSRRDFTVNAMAVEVPDGELIDPFGGVDDLKHRRLRTPMGPDVSFDDDPLRMLRAARFVAGYGLEPAAELLDAITTLRARLDIVSVERRRDEIDRLLRVDDPGPALELLVETGLAPHAIPGLAELDGWSRSALSAEVAALPVGRLRLAALASSVAGDDAGALLRGLRYPNDEQRAVEAIHRAVASLPAPDASEPELRRWVAAAGSHRPAALVLARARADATGRRPERVDALEATLADLAEREDLTDLGPPIDGDAVMDHLGLDAGPEVGAALDMLTEHRLDHGPYGAAEAERLLDEWRRARR